LSGRNVSKVGIDNATVATRADTCIVKREYLKRFTPASSSRAEHVFDGHRFPGKPGKSLFPESWSKDKIIGHVNDVARDSESTWCIAPYQRTRSGLRRYYAEGTRENVNVRVVVEPRGEGIITSYPPR
jgi:hypothetical protein